MTQSTVVAPLQQAKSMAARLEKQFSQALPQQLPSKKFVRTLQTALSRQDIAEKINEQKMDMNSVWDSSMKCAQDGLVLDGREATMLTFWSNKERINKAQYIPMVAGLMKKARNSGEIKSIIAKVVYEADQFEQWVDENGEHFKHIPAPKERGAPLKVYALGITKDGGTQLEVLEREDIDAIARSSKNAKQYDPKQGEWFGEWWKKAAIRRVCKYLPSSSELDRLFEHDNENFDLDDDKPEPAPVEPVNTSNIKSAAESVLEAEVEDAEVIEVGANQAAPAAAPAAAPDQEAGDPI